jgi:hypothetical protein
MSRKLRSLLAALGLITVTGLGAVTIRPKAPVRHGRHGDVAQHHRVERRILLGLDGFCLVRTRLRHPMKKLLAIISLALFVLGSTTCQQPQVYVDRSGQYVDAGHRPLEAPGPQQCVIVYTAYTSSSTYTVPQNCFFVPAFIMGAGGAGGGGAGGTTTGATSNSSGGAGGGAAGNFVPVIVKTAPGNTLTITTGVGGFGSNSTGGTAGNNGTSGQNGGNSSIVDTTASGTQWNAIGGQGGQGGIAYGQASFFPWASGGSPTAGYPYNLYNGGCGAPGCGGNGGVQTTTLGYQAAQAGYSGASNGGGAGAAAGTTNTNLGGGGGGGGGGSSTKSSSGGGQPGGAGGAGSAAGNGSTGSAGNGGSQTGGIGSGGGGGGGGGNGATGGGTGGAGGNGGGGAVYIGGI